MGIFTRENEELLSYDADAFFYFAGTMLTVLLLPWTWLVVQWVMHPRPPAAFDYDARGPAPKGAVVRRCGATAMEAKRSTSLEAARKWRYRLGGSVGIQVVTVAILWICLVVVCWKLKDTPPELRSFDPYRILGLEPNAELKDIKKAYRQKSLQHHPDKDRENPLAPVMFQQVTKAYAALTDEGARKNYAKYGNPDGPTQMKVGIALHPAMLVSKGSQMTTLVLFFGILFIVPFSIVCCCLRGSNLSAGGVCAETLRIYGACIDIETRADHGPALIAASVEARRKAAADIRGLRKAMTLLKPMPLQPGTFVQVTGQGELQNRIGVLRSCPANSAQWEVELWPTSGPPERPEQCERRTLPKSAFQPVEPRIQCPFSDAPIHRGTALLWAHIWRLHSKMDPPVRAELQAILQDSSRLGRAMCSIAAHGHGDRSGFFDVVRGLVHFRRCLVQALDLDESPLLQLPHVTEVPPKAPTLREVVEGAADSFLQKLRLSPQQLLDVRAFCQHAPRVEVTCRVEVSDEDEIAEGDMATLSVSLVRTNLAENEAAGPVHAPLFPGPKFEEWWLLVYDDRGRRLITTEVILGTGRKESAKIHFMVPRPGDFRWTVHAMCDSYAGLDVECAVPFVAKRRSEVDRSIFIHPEDAKIKTLFEELMEGLQQEEVESESEDEDERKLKAAAAAKVEDKAQAQEDGPTKAAQKAADPGSSEDDLTEPEGLFFRVLNPRGAHIYKEPEEDPQLRMGTIPTGMPIRGFESHEGWIQLAWGGPTLAWVRTGPSCLQNGEDEAASGHPRGAPEAECLGTLSEQQLRTVVQTHATMSLIRRWMRGTTRDIEADDLLQVREIDDPRARMLVEEMARKHVGDERFDRILDEVQAIADRRKSRFTKALGHFATQNGIIWHVSPAGVVRGLHQDGSRIRDRIQLSDDGSLQIGPFRLDESRTCSCIHWHRKDDHSKEWVWSPDRSLRTRVRLGLPENNS